MPFPSLAARLMSRLKSPATEQAKTHKQHAAHRHSISIKLSSFHSSPSATPAHSTSIIYPVPCRPPPKKKKGKCYQNEEKWAIPFSAGQAFRIDGTPQLRAPTLLCPYIISRVPVSREVLCRRGRPDRHAHMHVLCMHIICTQVLTQNAMCICFVCVQCLVSPSQAGVSRAPPSQ